MENEPVLLLFATLVLFPYAKSSISLIFVKKTQFSSLKKRLFIAYITKIPGGIFLVSKNLSFGIVKSKIDHFRKVPCEHTVDPKFLFIFWPPKPLRKSVMRFCIDVVSGSQNVPPEAYLCIQTDAAVVTYP